MPAALAEQARFRRHRIDQAGLALLFVLALFYVYGALADLVALAGHELPADHRGTFTSLAGTSFASARGAHPAITSYILVLERGYALHELTFALLFLLLLAWPFRLRQRWAWWAAWLVMIANLGYTLTFGIHDYAILARSLVADIAMPLLLIAQLPAFLSREQRAGLAVPRSTDTVS